MSKTSKQKAYGQQAPLQPLQLTTLSWSKSNVQPVLPEASDTSKRWRTIYPQYINSNLTMERGRRLAKSKCVVDPMAEEIYSVLAAHPHFEVQLNMQKCYCREMDKENIRTRGYIKYRLLDDKQFQNKRQILQYVASMIPKLKSRQNPKSGVSATESVSSKPSANKPLSVGLPSGGKKKNRRK